MNFPSIDIQGSILSNDLLAKIRSEQAGYQQGKDFNPGLTNARLKDEISAAWQDAKGQWNIFRSKLARVKEGETATTETRNFWMAPLLTNLGYNLTFSRAAEEINGKTFPIGYRDSSLDNFPVYVGGYHESLDKRPEHRQLRVSPHALVQEYLNYSSHLYGLVTNGRQLRLLRDASRITRLSYVEFNLEKMMEEDLYSDFVILYRLLHASRMPKLAEDGAESIIEQYHQQALEAGSTIRSKLGDAVKNAIQNLANGFLNHPANNELRKLAAGEKLDADEFYRQLLRIIYRLLFLFVIEERNLVYANNKSPETKRFSQIYFNYFSLMRLRKSARKLLPPEADRHHDLWQGLMNTFSLFEKKEAGEKLGIMALQGDLFGYDAICNSQYDLHHYLMSNATLLHIIQSLSYFENENGVLIAVNYGGLDVEEFGSVYEGLLELKLDIKKVEGSEQYSCGFHSSSERSKSGSHYTPEELVQPLIKHSLDYLIEDIVDSGKWLVVSGDKNSSNNYFKIAPYAIFKKLSGINSLEEIYGLGKNDLLFYKVLSERRDVWLDIANKKSSSEHSGQHSGGTGEEHNGGVSSVSGNRQRFFSGVRDFDDTLKGIGLSDERAIRNFIKELRGDSQIAERIKECIKEVDAHYPLPTTHLLLSDQPVIDKLLSLKVADVACGSGHILLSAARRIAHEVACITETVGSGSKQKVEQPSPTSVRKAMKEVVRNCIYGVDKNPLAVELCKIALWLEAYNPGEPLNFLDHHIKCGDAIVGLAHRSELDNGIANEAFKTLPGDDKDIAREYRDKNIQERKERKASSVQVKAEFEQTTENSVHEVMEEYQAFNKLPETTPEEIDRKTRAYRKFLDGKGHGFLKAMADTSVAQFFIPKTIPNKDLLMTDGDFRQILRGYKGWQARKVAKATAVAAEHRFFHWFLEFPEVFNDSGSEQGRNGGFDCILGNPPFLGGQKLSGTFGDNFLECIKYEFAPIGAVDLVTYFFRRIFSIIKEGGFQSLISTNTIAQGKAREEGLDVIVKHGGAINHAVRSTKWPGVAAVEVALVTITKQQWKGKFYLGTKEVKTITPYLDDAETLGNPYPLKQNENKSFQGSIVLGKGFVLKPQEAAALIAKDPRNKDVLFPYLNGDDLNNNPDQSPSRWVINFFDWPEEKAKTYPDCYEIVERLVKPEREKLDGTKNSTNKNRKEKWWLYGSDAKSLYQTIAPLERVLVVAQVSKTLGFAFVTKKQVISMMCIVLATDKFTLFAFLKSQIHREWVHQYGSALKSDIRYTPSDVFETFPFPQNLTPQQEQQLETIGEAYHEHRRQLMLGMQLGLTKTYNLFHDPMVSEQWLVDRKVDSGKWIVDSEETLHNQPLPTKNYPPPSKNLQALIKHLEKTPGTISLEEAIKGIEKLRELHVQMDEAVLDAYGWGGKANDEEANGEQQMANSEGSTTNSTNSTLTTNHCPLPTDHSPLILNHNFYEVDYLPENDRIRFTIHPDARKEVLKRLLELNHKIHGEEVKAGLWDKKKTSSKKYKPKNKSSEVNEARAGYGRDLFNQGEE